MTTPDPEGDADGPVKRVVAAGSEMTGAAIGAGVGLLGGPPGVIAGAAVGAALAAGLREVANRTLARREEVRVGAAARYALERVEEHYEAGETLRTDEFFEHVDGGRSDADELYEASLLAAQRAAQEKKVRHIGYLMANLAFRPEISGATAAWALRTAEDLTWTQLVLLAGIERGAFSDSDMDIGKNRASWDSWGVHAQLSELGWGQRGFIYGKREETEKHKFARINMTVGEQQLANGGQLLVYLLDLDRVSDEEVEAVKQLLDRTHPEVEAELAEKQGAEAAEHSSSAPEQE